MYHFFLLLLTRAYIPEAIKIVITGPSFSLNPSSYFPFSYFSWYKKILDSFDFGLSNSLLESFEIKSDSSVYNCSSFASVVVIWALLHLILLLIKSCWSTSQSNQNTSWWFKAMKWLVDKAFEFFTFGFYIRSFLEINQFMLVSSVSEIHQFNIHGGLRITSLIFAFLVLMLCLSLILISLSFAVSSNEEDQNKHKYFKEFFVGLKLQKKFRWYNSAQILRRTLFVLVLIIFDKTLVEIIVAILWGLQFFCVIHVVVLRPFEEIRANIIEVLNEVYILVLFATLIFLNTESNWSSTKTTIYIWVLSSNSIINIFDCLK